jgi:DNA-binding transcriptional regulator GbsR (MarR family)
LLDNGGVSTDDITEYLGVSRPTAGRTMTELSAVGLVEEYERKEQSDTQFTKHIRLKDKFNWFLSDEFKKLRDDFKPINYKKANKEKLPPYTHNQENIDLSQEQKETLWSTFLSIEKEQEDLPSDIDRDTVSGEVLRQRLVKTGIFQYNDDAAILIERMYELGAIDRVSYETYTTRL